MLPNLANSAANLARQAWSPDEKIFFIGFDKCATSALHRLMKYNGIRSVHFSRGKDIIAEKIELLSTEPGRLQNYLRWTAYSDLHRQTETMKIDANRRFRLLHQLFPNAYFVLNDRDREAWIRSRTSHRDGLLMERATAFHRAAPEKVQDIWREDHAEHIADATHYFAGNDRFLHFFVDQEPIERLIAFLAPSYRLSPWKWARFNVTALATART